MLLCASVDAQTYWNGTQDTIFAGTGTQIDPFLISTSEELAGLAYRTNVRKEDFAGQYFQLTSDIYLTNFNDPDTAQWKEWEPIAHTLMQWGSETDYGYFRGHFDGNNHTIYNMFYGDGLNFAEDWNPTDWDMNLEDYDFSVMNKALFGNLEGATLLNIHMANAKMEAPGEALLALNTDANTVIRNCHVQGEMRMDVAGLVGTNNGLIEDCSVNIRSTERGGGAFVSNNGATGIIRNCTSTGHMRCTRGPGAGFVSTNYGLIEKCTADVYIEALYGLNTTLVDGKKKYEHRSGAGFVMSNGGTIRECAAFGNLVSDGTYANYVWYSAIAGFAYRNWGGRIESCYCTGTLRDVSDSTGVYGDPIFASFCYDNGCDAGHINDDIYRGDIFNCYSTSSFQHHDVENGKNRIHAFVGSFHGYGGFDAETVEQSCQIGCYFNQEGLPATTGQATATWDGTGKTMTQIQSQAFVDTLNLLASFFNLSQWELRDGLPRPMGVYQQNTNIFFGGGDGTKDNPYIIATKQHLQNLAWLVQQGTAFKDTYFKQTADIALNVPKDQWEYVAPTRWTPIGSPVSNSWYTNTNIREFKGIYDGGFHEVKNLYINNLLDKQGLFGRIAKGAQLRNLGVTDAYIRSCNHGVIVGEIAEKPIVVQCWTSGNIATQGQYAGSQGALIGNMAGGSYILNCGTSVQMSGHGNAQLSIYDDAVYGGFNVWSQDTLVNFLFTGKINGSGKYGSFQHRENFFADKETAQVEYLGDGTEYGDPNCTLDSTRWIQSKDLVNIYNYSVARWNERHAGNDTLQLHYWEWREGDYPRVSPDASFLPPVTITFNSNGGSSVTTKYVYPDSEVLPPQRPLREGYLFAGWYKDPALTQFYDWTTERPTSSMTLYARWHEDKRFDIDVTPFQNEFAKTYKIKTAAQLRGFAAMQNGMYTWEENVPCYDTEGNHAVGILTQTQAPMDFKGKKVVLDNDILLCDTTDWQYWGRGAFGVPWTPIGWYYGVYGEGDHAFHGTFDGQGHTVYGMYMERNGAPGWNGYGENVGLFGETSDTAVIRNVGVAASVLDGQDYNTRGQYSDATKYWKRCGFGEQGWRHVGMLVGVTSVTHVEQCYAEGNIYCQDQEANALIGSVENYWSLYNDTISDCYTRVNIYNKKGNPTNLFAGSSWTTTYSHCYNAGITQYGITNCTSYGIPVQESTYFNKELGATATGCDGRGCTTNEMHAKVTYQNWDFENIWGRNDSINNGYPYLRVFHENAPTDSEDPIVVTGITVDVSDTTIIAGSTLQVNATILPDSAADKRVTWTADTWGVSGALEYDFFESIDQNGLVTTHLDLGGNGYANGRSGNIRITATSYEGDYQASFILTIAQPSITIVPVAYRRHGETEWKYDRYSQYFSPSINTENFEYMVLAYTNIDAAREGLTWSVDNEDVLSITEMTDTVFNIYYAGQKPCSRVMVYAKISGNANLTATLPNGQSKTLYSEISRVDLVSPSYYISIYQSPYTSWQRANTTMVIGETQQLEVYNGYEDRLSYLPTYQWSSSDPSVLTVDQNGLVTAVGLGTATITVEAVGTNVSATTDAITVSIVEATSITINEGGYWWSEIEVSIGDTYQLTATVLPENTTDKSVTWQSSNETVATIDQNGLVTALSTGTTQITVTTSNGQSAYTNIRVKDIEPTSITINEKTGEAISLHVGDTYQLTVTVLPENASNQTITWRTANRRVASVDAGGLVQALREGTVDVTARTNNGLIDTVTFVITEWPLDSVYFTIRFLNYDSTELQVSQVLQGDMPAYLGETPTRPADSFFVYIFDGWSPEIVPAEEYTTYIATYRSTGTDLPALPYTEQPMKVLEDGHLYILLPDGTRYSTTGKKVR